MATLIALLDACVVTGRGPRLWGMVLDACPGDAKTKERGEAAQRIEKLPANRRRLDALRVSPEGPT